MVEVTLLVGREVVLLIGMSDSLMLIGVVVVPTVVVVMVDVVEVVVSSVVVLVLVLLVGLIHYEFLYVPIMYPIR